MNYDDLRMRWLKKVGRALSFEWFSRKEPGETPMMFLNDVNADRIQQITMSAVAEGYIAGMNRALKIFRENDMRQFAVRLLKEELERINPPQVSEDSEE